MSKKSITKTTLAVSLDIEVAEKIKEMARNEERSVSQMVQRALVHYLPTIESEISDHEQKAIDHLVNRLAAVVSSPEVSRSGMTPTEIRLEDGGQVVIRLQPNDEENQEAKDRAEEPTLEQPV